MEWKSCSHLATSTSASRTTSRPSAGSKSSSPGAKLLLLLQARCPVRGYQPGQRLGQRSKEIKSVKEIVNRLVSKVWGVRGMSLGVAIILLSYLISWSSRVWWFGQRHNWIDRKMIKCPLSKNLRVSPRPSALGLASPAIARKLRSR